MSEEKQAETSIENSDTGSNDDAVVEQRVAKKQSSYVGTLLLIAILAGVGVAASYYQGMWLPQAKQLLAKFIPVQEEVDPMAAPRLEEMGDEDVSKENESGTYALLPAIQDEKPVEETSKDVVAEPVSSVPASVPAVQAEESPMLVESVIDDVVKDVANDVVMDDETPVINNSAVEIAETESVAATAVTLSAPRVQDATSTASIGQARQAFWARDLVKAESLYRGLLQHETSNADAWGELGNIYYGQAKWPQAAEAYAEAAIQLFEQGQYSQAMFLHYVVRGLDPLQAARIDAKLHTMQSSPKN